MVQTEDKGLEARRNRYSRIRSFLRLGSRQERADKHSGRRKGPASIKSNMSEGTEDSQGMNGAPNGAHHKKQTKEDQSLQQFKSRVQDLIKPEHDDHYLTKWLKARCFDVTKAENMFRASMSFREKYQVDKILQEYNPPEVLQKYLTGGFCGHDKDGSPVRVELFGYLDMKGLMYSTKKVDLEKTKLLQCEHIVDDWQKQSEKLGKRVDGLTVIFDMDNAGTKSLWRPGLQMYLHLIKILEDNYPEMMKRLYVVNAPRIFPLLWKIGRPLVSEDMKNKIHVLGSDYQSVLLENIDADQLPEYLGGTLTDPDGNGRCATKIVQGGDVPQSYYFNEAVDTESMQSTTVEKGDKFKLEITVEHPGSVLRWEFMTEDYDIAFGVYLRQKGVFEELVKVDRINCHMVPEEGSIICDRPGIYQVCFDNTYSWTKGKKLYYVVELHHTDSATNKEVNQLAGGKCLNGLSEKMETTRL